MPAIINTAHVWERMLMAARTRAALVIRTLTLSPATNAQTKDQTAIKQTPIFSLPVPDVVAGTLGGIRGSVGTKLACTVLYQNL
jgi:hypothetical protein